MALLCTGGVLSTALATSTGNCIRRAQALEEVMPAQVIKQ